MMDETTGGIMAAPQPDTATGTIPVTMQPDPDDTSSEALVDDCEVCFAMVVQDKMADHVAALHPDAAAQAQDWIRRAAAAAT
jgi:hypothetical protein